MTESCSTQGQTLGFGTTLWQSMRIGMSSGITDTRTRMVGDGHLATLLLQDRAPLVTSGANCGAHLLARTGAFHRRSSMNTLLLVASTSHPMGSRAPRGIWTRWKVGLSRASGTTYCPSYPGPMKVLVSRRRNQKGCSNEYCSPPRMRGSSSGIFSQAQVQPGPWPTDSGAGGLCRTSPKLRFKSLEQGSYNRTRTLSLSKTSATTSAN